MEFVCLTVVQMQRLVKVLRHSLLQSAVAAHGYSWNVEHNMFFNCFAVRDQNHVQGMCQS